jgi:hypothetical protein
MGDTIHEHANKFLFPTPPGCGSGSQRVSFGQCIKQSKTPEIADAFGNMGDRSVIREVASSCNIGQKEMMTDHLLEHQSVLSIETHARADLGNEFDTHVGVIAWSALADVMQQRAHYEEVGAIDAIYERGSVRGRFAQMPINGEAVIGVALRSAPDDPPLGKDRFPESLLIESLHNLNGRSSGEEQFGEQTASLVRPGLWNRSSISQSPERGSINPGVGLCSRNRNAQHEKGI